jgi:hypothetical protein
MRFFQGGDFPLQGIFLNRRVEVTSFGDPLKPFKGTCVRDDYPQGVTIIRLDDGRHVLGTECCYWMDSETGGRLCAPPFALCCAS